MEQVSKDKPAKLRNKTRVGGIIMSRSSSRPAAREYAAQLEARATTFGKLLLNELGGVELDFS